MKRKVGRRLKKIPPHQPPTIPGIIKISFAGIEVYGWVDFHRIDALLQLNASFVCVCVKRNEYHSEIEVCLVGLTLAAAINATNSATAVIEM